MVPMHHPAPDVLLDAKVAFLRQPENYPHPAYRVEAIETHMSWVFLAGAYAYKLKKPVRLALLDFRSLDARRHYCEEEVRLNRRLAPDIYLGTVALGTGEHGHLRLGGQDGIVDWLVRMRRIPVRHMLDHAIHQGNVRENDLRRLAAVLAAFYGRCSPVPIDPCAYRAGFSQQVDRNQRDLSRAAYRMPIAEVDELCRAQRALLACKREWFDRRVAAHRIVEGHGDLRPEHVCLAPEISVIDCLEFSRELRIVDPADELGFLAMECERMAAGHAGQLVLRAYAELAGDRPGAGLVHFYQGFRASLRAWLTIRHLDEDKFRYSAQWRRRAGAYLALARRHQALADAAPEGPI